MFVLGKYSLASLYFPTIVGLSIVCVLFFTFGFQFLKWRREIKQSLGILLFAFSFLLLGVVQLIDLPYLSLTMSQIPKIVTPTYEIIPPLDIQDKSLIFLIDRSVYVDYATFALMLFGTALLLWHYSRRINKLVLLGTNSHTTCRLRRSRYRSVPYKSVGPLYTRGRFPHFPFFCRYFQLVISFFCFLLRCSESTCWFNQDIS